MQKTRLKKSLSLILCILLIAALALFTSGCNDKKTVTPDSLPVSASTEAEVLGEGKTSFDLTVTDSEGKETSFVIHTDKSTVGDALQELGLIDGDEGEFGLYIKTVNGETVDFDKDGKYWAFYVNGEYALSGVDTTEIEEGALYSLRVEK